MRLTRLDEQLRGHFASSHHCRQLFSPLADGTLRESVRHPRDGRMQLMPLLLGAERAVLSREEARRPQRRIRE